MLPETGESVNGTGAMPSKRHRKQVVKNAWSGGDGEMAVDRIGLDRNGAGGMTGNTVESWRRRVRLCR